MDGKLRNMTSVYLTGDEGILCLYRIGSKVANHLHVGAAGGHFEKDELNDARACVLREMNEELGLSEMDVDGLRLRYITYRLKDGEIRQNYYFFGKLRRYKHLESTEGILKWVAYEDVPLLEMPVSAKHMLLHYVSVGCHTDALYAGITQDSETHFVEMREF